MVRSKILSSFPRIYETGGLKIHLTFENIQPFYSPDVDYLTQVSPPIDFRTML